MNRYPANASNPHHANLPIRHSRKDHQLQDFPPWRRDTQENRGTTLTFKPAVRCFKCGQQGHYAINCPKKSFVEAPVDKRINLCTSDNPRGYFDHNGERFSFIFDSGSDCSLIASSLTSRLEGTLSYKTVNLHGLGKAIVVCEKQILVAVTINSHYLKILFHIIPDEFLVTEPIVVGREIIKNELYMVVKEKSCTLSKNTSSLTPGCKYNSEEGNKLNKSRSSSSPNPNFELGNTRDLITEHNITSKVSTTQNPNKLSSLTHTSHKNNTPLYDPLLLASGSEPNPIITDVPPSHKSKLNSILGQYRNFFINGIPRTRVKTGEMTLRLKDTSKINSQRPYKLGNEKREATRKLVNDLLEAQVIQPSRSPFASPAFPVPKKKRWVPSVRRLPSPK